MSRLTAFRFQVERIVFAGTLLVIRILPAGMVRILASALGRLIFLVDSRHRQVALGNLASAFPEAGEQKRREIARACFRHFARYLFDFLACVQGFRKLYANRVEVTGLEHLRAAYERGKGVLCVTGHYGAWELMALEHGALGFPLGVIGRALDNPHLERLLNRLRTSTGNFVIDKRDALRPVLRALKEGKGVAILIDQNVTTDERIFVDFFRRPASTTPAMALFKLKTDAEIIPAFSWPEPGNRYRFDYGPPVRVELSGDRNKDVLRITQECTRALEEKIQEAPQYWFWMHRRWKTRPEAEDV